jgi:hypothetical protein
LAGPNDYKKGFRRERDPTGELHSANAQGVKLGSGVSTKVTGQPLKKSPVIFNGAGMSQVTESDYYPEEEAFAAATPTTIPSIPSNAIPTTVPTLSEGVEPAVLNPGSMNSDRLEATEDRVLSEESEPTVEQELTGLPGAEAGQSYIPETPGSPLAPARLAEERSPIMFARKTDSEKVPFWRS